MFRRKKEKENLMVVATTKETMELVTVTPALAAQWLERMPKNRNLRQGWVNTLAHAIEQKDWQFNGEPIRFGRDGALLDGQHRLHAIIQADQSADFIVVTGLEPDSIYVTDTGKPRSASDALHLRGEKDAHALAGACHWLIIWEQAHNLTRIGGSGRQFAPTIADILRVLDKNPSLRHALPHGNRLRKSLTGGPSLWGFLAFLLQGIDPEDAAFFFERLLDGADLKGDSPLLLLRKRLTERRPGQAGAPMPPREIGALTIKAWNFYREGKSIAQLSWRPGGSRPESFPIPV
jgi:hypothetical protein